jgi:hypothetical protein
MKTTRKVLEHYFIPAGWGLRGKLESTLLVSVCLYTSVINVFVSREQGLQRLTNDLFSWDEISHHVGN